MIYFKKNDELIEKYQIIFNKEKVEKLKSEIINNCSFIKHEEYESDYSPKFTDEIIRNFKCSLTGKKKDYFEETRDIYLYSYDEYKPPYLVELINQLLKGNTKVIDKILKYDTSTTSNLDDKIRKLNQEFIRIDPENITKKKAKLDEIEELLKTKELNKNQQSIEFYYNELMKLINIVLIDSISVNELNKIEEFLEIKILNKIKINNFNEKSHTKILKKID